MNKLEELIRQHCPNGVPRVALEQCININTGDQLNKSAMLPMGDYPVINGGISASGFTDKYNTEANTTTISQGGNSAGYVNWLKTRFWAGAHCFVISPHKGIDDRYVYHFLKLNESGLMKSKQGAGIPSVGRKTILSLEIPLPPLPVQQEIVRILDTFTDLQDNLQQELEARRKQYEVYREKLLNFNEIGGGNERVRVDAVAKISRGVRVVRANLNENGDYPVYQNSLTPLGYYSKFNNPDNTTFIICAGAAGDIGYSEQPFWAADDCSCFDCGDRVLSRYLFYCLQSQQVKIKSQVRKASVPRLSKSALERLEIPIQPVQTQKKIIDELDAFIALQDIVRCEILARQKQYEYYREKLLTF